MALETVTKGMRLIAYPTLRPASRIYILVNRVAQDGTWADIACHTWAVKWTKRQPLPLHNTIEQDWCDKVFALQECDHMAMLNERKH